MFVSDKNVMSPKSKESQSPHQKENIKKTTETTPAKRPSIDFPSKQSSPESEGQKSSDQGQNMDHEGNSKVKDGQISDKHAKKSDDQHSKGDQSTKAEEKPTQMKRGDLDSTDNLSEGEEKDEEKQSKTNDPNLKSTNIAQSKNEEKPSKTDHNESSILNEEEDILDADLSKLIDESLLSDEKEEELSLLLDQSDDPLPLIDMFSEPINESTNENAESKDRQDDPDKSHEIEKKSKDSQKAKPTEHAKSATCDNEHSGVHRDSRESNSKPTEKDAKSPDINTESNETTESSRKTSKCSKTDETGSDDDSSSSENDESSEAETFKSPETRAMRRKSEEDKKWENVRETRKRKRSDEAMQRGVVERKRARMGAEKPHVTTKKGEFQGFFSTGI